MNRLGNPWICTVALGCFLACACGANRSAPSAVLSAYRDALKNKRFGKAYDLMSKQFRAEYSRKEYVRIMRANPSEVAYTVEQIDPTNQTTEIGAELRFGLGERLRLVWQNGWQIASDPIAFYSQDTPRDALRSFVRAYQLKRWKIMLRFVPKAYRSKMTVQDVQKQFVGQGRAEITGMMVTLAENIDQPIEEQGAEARMTYGNQHEVRFSREKGVWVIQDLQ